MDVATLEDLFHRSALEATLAPSVHNTQPWNLVLGDGFLELHADPDRQLHVLDPAGRQLFISCGCALFNARVALAADGYDAVVDRLPDPDRPNFLARLRLPAQRSPWLALGDLQPAIERRHTNRRDFEPTETVSDETLGHLDEAATAEGCELLVVRERDDRRALAALGRQADALQTADPAYREELFSWTSDDPQRRDGVPAMAVPYAAAASNGDLLGRDFDTRHMGWLSTRMEPAADGCLVLLGTAADDPGSWLRAGEALERIWLLLTLADYVASPLTQAIEVPHIREQVRVELGLQIYPQVVLRIGRAPTTIPTRRRDLDDVLGQVSDDH